MSDKIPKVGVIERLLDLLHATFHRPGSRSYKFAESTVWLLIFVSVIIVIVEVLITSDGQTPPKWLLILDRGVLWCFAVEYILRVFSFRPPILKMFKKNLGSRMGFQVLGRVHYMFSPLLLLDLLAILALFPILRSLRVLRLLRLLRSVQLFRYSSPFMGIVRTFQENALLYFFTFGFLFSVVLLGGVTMFLTEHSVKGEITTIREGIWWALVTITTVGYGDFTPVTAQGRIVGGVVMVLGMFTLALFAGIVSSTLLRVMVNLRKDQFRMSSYSNHIVICCYDQGASLMLNAILAEVEPGETELVVFGNGDRPTNLPPEFIWINGDPSKESELDKVRMSHAKVAIIVGSRTQEPAQADATTILVAFTIRSYLENCKETKARKQPLYVISEILDPENADHAKAAGCDEVIETTRLGFALMAHAAMVPGSGTIMSQVASTGAQSLFIGKNPLDRSVTYAELANTLHGIHGIVLIGLRIPGTGAVELNPEDVKWVKADCEVAYLAEVPVLDVID